jgi:phage terminase large subunit-like protein
MDNLAEALQLIEELEKRKKYFSLDYYQPYAYQRRFHNARGKNTDKPAIQRALQCANQIGKSYCGCREDAYHLTGLYPDWWSGTRFLKPPLILVAGKTNDSTKNILQKELFGDAMDPDSFGSGAVPKHLIGEVTRKPGVPNAYSEVLVKHVSGKWSKVIFMSYEMKARAFMGYRFDAAHLDEEPPTDVYEQVYRSTLSTNGVIYLTYTPEEGVTEIVHRFMQDLQTGQAFITATWDDAPHFTEEMKALKIAALSPTERDMRSKGIPRMGAGQVFPFTEDEIAIDPIELPPWWPRICAVDFGWDHPFAAVWLAYDRDGDVVYVYDAFRESKALMAVQASAINSRGDWIPVIWPHDGMHKDPKSGRALADIFREDFKVNMRRDPFSNPPGPGQKDGEGGISVWPGIEEMKNRMATGRLKVFKTLTPWFEEFKSYHTRLNEKGVSELVKIRDDLMSATRYAVQSIRHAQTKTVRQPKQNIPQGLRNW